VTKLYIYCLFEKDDNFYGVYSSLKAAHRDALKLCNKGNSEVYIITESGPSKPTFGAVRGLFQGECDVKVKYTSNVATAVIIKTKLRE
tara:strand:- start:379 stop:642 length:264 start_codon:yes stop_codon:yes gene_type:complete